MGAVLALLVLLVTIVSIAITRTAASNQLPPEAAAAAEVGAEGLSWGSGFSTYPALKEVVRNHHVTVWIDEDNELRLNFLGLQTLRISI